MNSKKITIKEILVDKYDDFKNKYWHRVTKSMREHVDRNNNWWKSVDYIPYPFLKKEWQKVLLDIIKKHFNCYKTRQLISNMYKKYKNGFYVNAKRKLDDTRQAVKYIGRYLARAAISEYRIEEYDGEKITFWYEDHDDGHKIRITMDVLEFIGKITQHISPKGFKTVRRYGLYSRRRNKISKEIVHLYNFVKQMSIDKFLKNKKAEVKKKKLGKKEL